MLSLLSPLWRHQGRNLLRQIHTSSLLAAKKLEKFKLADIGEGITECEIIKWNVKEAASIQAFDQLCEVQSDKASVEITSPFDGIVKELLVKEGEIAKVGEGLCLIEVEEEDATTEDAASVDIASVSKPVEKLMPDNKPGESPERPTEAIAERVLHPLDPKAASASQTKLKADERSHPEVLATPSVRHLAKQKSVDLSELAPGSGKGGRIEKRDIEAYLEGQRSSAKPYSSPATKTEKAAGEPITIELGRTRAAMWKAMTKSLEIPHFGYSTYLDVTALHSMLPSMNTHIPQHFLPENLKESGGPQAISPQNIYGANAQPPALTSDPLSYYTKLTLLPFLLKALSKAMHEWPIFRSSITSTNDAKPSITIRPQADVSIAVSTPSGLYSPTITRLDALNPFEIMGRLRRLSNLGRQTPCGLGAKEMPKHGGSITVSNVGAIGAGEFASPLLVPGGGVAIVALGRARWSAEIDEGSGAGETSLERRLKMGISWSADHRVVEGAELAAFVECWRSWVEHPVRLIADGR